MAADERTMFEIFREGDYNRAFHYIFYTDLEEHARDDQITKAAAGETVYTGFLADETKEQARAVVEAIVDELNDMDEDEAGMDAAVIRDRLSAFLVDNPVDGIR
ncbi:MAG: hypothetical protein ACE37F_05805 [Nannocystaceae bacterium]|nr:hypothetical protein [bacterium]